MTLLIAAILSDDPAEAAELAHGALAGGADAVEIRLDGWGILNDAGLAVLKSLPPGQWIATCRPTSEGGRFDGDLAERVSWLTAACACGAGYVDFEFADWQRSDDIRRELRLALARRDCPDADKPGLILSSHDFSGRPTDLPARLAAMSAVEGVAAVKVAWAARSAADNLAAFDLLRTARVPTIAICMGEAGLASRVLAKKFGAFGVYCAPSAGQEAAPGQVTLEQMLQDYRWPVIDESTAVYGVLGDPVGHSMSPAVFNSCFAQHVINAVYLPMCVERSAGALAEFVAGCADRPWLDVGGFSVTVPHKEAAAEFVGRRIEPPADRIGAVNTLVRTGDGFAGYNTDYDGALDAITGALGCPRSGLVGLRANVLGAGGVARAVVAGLVDCGADVTVYNRSAARARALAAEFDCHHELWARRAERTDARLLVNCTSVGMWPDVEAIPMPADRLDGELTVFDTVYNPVETRLLRDAARGGCRTVDGLSMFISQAAAQFRLWTGQDADKAFMRRIVEERLA